MKFISSLYLSLHLLRHTSHGIDGIFTEALWVPGHLVSDNTLQQVVEFCQSTVSNALQYSLSVFFTLSSRLVKQCCNLLDEVIGECAEFLAGCGCVGQVLLLLVKVSVHSSKGEEDDSAQLWSVLNLAQLEKLALRLK